MTLDELIESIHTLEMYLQRFEDKYQLRSEDFYRQAQQDKLEQTLDFIEWLGVYEIKLRREQKYQHMLDEILKQQPRKVQLPIPQLV